jgi:hypothetical protein
MSDLPYTIEDIRSLYSQNKIVWKDHATERMLQREILRTEVKQCMMSGEIIEVYLSDKPYPSCLILGYTSKNRPLHVVCSTEYSHIYIITVYEPTLKKWEADFKTRKDV